MRLDRRWWLAIGVAVAWLSWLVLSNTVFDGPSEECKPVKAMLDFNNSQGELIASKASDSDPAVPTVAEDAVYQQWADGMAQRAQQVTDPNLAATAIAGRRCDQSVRRQVAPDAIRSRKPRARAHPRRGCGSR